MIQKPVLFKNFSSEEFTWKIDGQEHTFKSAEVREMEDFEFRHFQKHLVDREMTKEGIRTNDQLKRKEYEEKCVVNVEEPKAPEEPKEQATEKPKEEEFEGLKKE